MSIRAVRDENPVEGESPEQRIIRLRREASRRHYRSHREQEIARSAKYNKENRGKTNANAVKRRAYKTPIHQVLYWNAKNRAKATGILFDLEPTDIIVPDFCPVLGLPLKVAVGFARDNSPSIDRIIPELGYVRGNIAVISHKANTIKSNASLADLRRVVTYLEALNVS